MKLKFTLAALACALVIASLVSCVDPVTGAAPTTYASLTSIAVSPDTATLAIAGTKEITVTATYSDGTTATITDATWTTSDAAVATVDAGTITAVAAGTATITATKEDKTATVAVTVNGPVAVSAPTSLFKDSGLTYKVGSGAAEGEKTVINSWESADTLGVIDNTQAATITLGSHPSGWSGGVALAQEPSNYTGKYDFSNVATIRFIIKSASIQPANLTVVAQNTAGDQTKTLASLGVSSMTSWTQVTIPVDTFITTGLKTDIKTALAFFWGSSAGDNTSLANGVSFQIGDIEFLNAAGTNVAFYTGVALPTAPSTRPADPTLPAANVISLHNSSGTYTNVPVDNWNPGWGQAGSISDATVDTKIVKVLNIGNYQGVAISSGGGSASGTGILDITGKNHLHLSYWTHDGTVLNISPVNATAEYSIAVGSITKDSWQEIDITINQAGFDLTTIRQLKFTVTDLGGGSWSGAGVFYLDNIYFH